MPTDMDAKQEVTFEGQTYEEACDEMLNQMTRVSTVFQILLTNIDELPIRLGKKIEIAKKVADNCRMLFNSITIPTDRERIDKLIMQQQEDMLKEMEKEIDDATIH